MWYRVLAIEPLLRALADPTRLRIMRLLSRLELAVGELAQLLQQSQPRVSRHVRILCDAGLAERRREGIWVFVRSRLPARPTGTAPLAFAAARLLDASEDADPEFAAICAQDRRRLAALRADRAERAARYFADHADEWDTLRILHGAEAPVETALADVLDQETLGALLDIGTGTGRIAELLGDRADRVVALDKSPDMLRIARARLQALPADRLELVQGDFTQLPFDDAAFDTVTLHQVLRYAPAPETVLREAARVVRAGGRIAIADLAPHTNEALRERHAHMRLGFGDEQMRVLLSDAGFAPGTQRTIAGAALTVKVWTGRRLGGTVTPFNPVAGALCAVPAKVAAR